MNDNDTKSLAPPPPQPSASRAQWLMSPGSSMGRTAVMTDQYEELRGLAIAQADEIADLRTVAEQTVRVSGENLRLANRVYACEEESARLRKLLHETEHVARRMIARDPSALFALLDKIAKED